MKDKLLKATEEKIESILEEGIETNNLEYLYKLVDIHKDMKEEESMNYGNYGNYNGYGNYGNYGNYSGRGAGYDSYGRGGYGEGSYGRRGVDAKYRGDDHLDRMRENYGRYEEGRSRYGANEDTKKSLEYMLRSMEDFAKMLKEEASSQEEVEMIRQTAQRIAQM